MTFDELWPILVIPGEFDAMDQCDQQQWRAVLQQAYEAGREHERDDAVISRTADCGGRGG